MRKPRHRVKYLKIKATIIPHPKHQKGGRTRISGFLLAKFGR